jgi:hypothetical protein
MIEEVEENDDYEEVDVDDLAACTTGLNKDQREQLLLQMIQVDTDF